MAENELKNLDESEERKKEIKAACEKYGIDEAELRNLLETSKDNVYIYEVAFGRHKIMTERSKWYEEDRPSLLNKFRAENVKAIIYNNNNKIVEYVEFTTENKQSREQRKLNPETVIFSDNLDSIGWYAFYGNKNLKSIRLPEGVDYIGNSAFEKSGLEEVEIPGSVKIIGDCAFKDSELKDVTLHEGLEVIGDNVFENTKVKEPKLPSSLKSSLRRFIAEKMGLTNYEAAQREELKNRAKDRNREGVQR